VLDPRTKKIHGAVKAVAMLVDAKDPRLSVDWALAKASEFERKHEGPGQRWNARNWTRAVMAHVKGKRK
jgi:hypothetical protein